MKLENQLTSLELSKRLDELGVKQDSLFYWIRNFHTNDDWKIGDNTDINNNKDAVSRRLEPLYKVGASAYTVAELGNFLPFAVDGKNKEIHYLTCDKSRDVWHVAYEDIRGNSFVNFASNTEANARGEMLAYLKENKLI